MLVLVAFERSGVVREAFRERGHEAWSCDLQETLRPGQHIVGDALDAIASQPWDLVIAHPPCTYLCSSGLHWNKRRPERANQTEEALRMVQLVWDLAPGKLCIENPVGCITTRLPHLGSPQYIQPYQFGDDASKRTGLWLRDLPELKAPPELRVKGRVVVWNGKAVERWANQCDSGQNALGPSEERANARSETYPGIARAMAEQWG